MNSLSFIATDEGITHAWQKERNAKMRLFDLLDSAFEEESGLSMHERKRARAERLGSTKFFMEDRDVADRNTPDNIQTLADN